MVTLDNAEEYVELMFDFSMHIGIQKQMEAFRGKKSSMYAAFHYLNLVYVDVLMFSQIDLSKGT